MSVECLQCGKKLRPQDEICTKCGSRDRQIILDESVKAREMIILKQKSSSFKKFKKRIKQGEKISRTGRLAKEELVIDKEKNWKYHFVEEQSESGEWETVHYHEGPLDEN